MGILGISKERQRLVRAWRELTEHPRPVGLAELARAWLALGEPDHAEEVLALGESLFPDSADLRRVRSLRLREAAADRGRRAKERLRSDPSVPSYLELADHYRCIGRSEACAATLHELLDRFGEHGTALAWLGEIRYQRYRHSLTASDGTAALQVLERAVAADRDALKPRLLLAQILHQVGAGRRSRRWLTDLLRLAPGHERATQLLQVTDDSDGPLDSLLLTVEEGRAFVANLPWEASAAVEASGGAALTTLHHELEGIEQAVPGAKAALVGVSHGAEPAEALHVEAARLMGFVERAARGMDLGVPGGLTVEAEDGALVLEMKRNAAVAVQAPAEADLAEAGVVARDALERLLTAAAPNAKNAPLRPEP